MASTTSSSFSARDILEKFYTEEQKFTTAPPDQRNFTPIASLFADSFTMEQSSALPWAGTYHGPQGLQTWMQKVSEWVTIDVRNPEIFQSSSLPDRIVVLSQVYYTCRKSGVKVDFPLSQTIDFDLERGLIVGIRPFYWDVKRLNAAMGYDGSAD